MRLLLAMFLLSSFVFAQQQPPVPNVVSPEIQSDGRVTFRVLAPNAKDVKLQFEGEPKPRDGCIYLRDDVPGLDRLSVKTGQSVDS